MTEEEKEILTKEKTRFKIPRSNTLPEASVNNILTKIQEKYSFASLYQAKAAVAVLFQQGGTSRSCDGNMTINVFDKDVKLAEIRKIVKEEGHNRGERKLARTIATPIYEICEYFDIPGNLYLKISRHHPERTFTLEEQVWLSDFQSLNDDAPSEMKVLIVESFDLGKNQKPSFQNKSNK